jgi:hypothetical protein
MDQAMDVIVAVEDVQEEIEEDQEEETIDQLLAAVNIEFL